MKNKAVILTIVLSFALNFYIGQDKLYIILAGLTHDHVNRILNKNKTGELVIDGIVEDDKELCDKKKAEWQLPDSLFFSNINRALKKTHPDLVNVFTAPSTHLAIIENSLLLHIPVMVEKPLCYAYAAAKRIAMLSKKFDTKVYTNFPSQWYKSFNGLLSKATETGTISKMIMRGGHSGPIEIGCSREFANWLTDSLKNGGGALIDFGCYGALIMTELMQGKAPIAVYPKVDDAATIVLEYPNATGVIEASWNWPYTIMDAELYGSKGYLHASEFNDSKPLPVLISKKRKRNYPGRNTRDAV